MDIRNVEDSAQISIHLFYLHNKYYIMLLNVNRNICVILIFIRIGEGLTHSHTMTPFDAQGNKPFENTVGKGEIARNKQFLLFPVFSTHLDNFLPFSSNLKLSSANSFSLEESKICCLVIG